MIWSVVFFSLSIYLFVHGRYMMGSGWIGLVSGIGYPSEWILASTVLNLLFGLYNLAGESCYRLMAR